MRNYFYLIFITYILIVLTKFVFILYLDSHFIELSFNELIYAIFWGIKFDLAVSAIVAFLVTLFDFNKSLLRISSIILLLTIFFTQIGDILYFNDSSRHIGYEINDAIADANSLFMTAYSQHTIITLLSFIFGLVLFILLLKITKTFNSIELNKYYIFKKLFIILLTVFFIRGMVQHIPLNPWQSNEIGNDKLAVISLNASYNIIYSMVNSKKQLEAIKIKNVNQQMIEDSFKTLYNNSTISKDLPIIKTKPNVVFLFSESWSAKFMQSYGFEKQTTPVFDRLLKNSIRSRAMIANGHRTTEGIFASLCSFQNPLGKTIAKTQLQNFKYDSIIKLFNEEKYSSAFFQGTAKDTSGTGGLVNYLGFKKSFGKRDVKIREHEENYWGLQDPDLYNFVLSKLDESIKEPFVIGINGATTHDSVVPEDFEKKNYIEKENLNNKLNALSFSDFAMGSFIEETEKKYPNTIFILFSDHCGGSIAGNYENYLIPFAIYSKKLIKPKYYDVMLSQRDIAPTINELVLGKNINKNGFTGKSLFSSDIFFADYFKNGILGWIENNKLIEIDIKTNKQKCFNLNHLTKESTSCNKEFNSLKTRALSFTKVSQELLFEGKTKEFIHYKK